MGGRWIYWWHLVRVMLMDGRGSVPHPFSSFSNRLSKLEYQREKSAREIDLELY